jgi:hypothetical protein
MHIEDLIQDMIFKVLCTNSSRVVNTNRHVAVIVKKYGKDLVPLCYSYNMDMVEYGNKNGENIHAEESVINKFLSLNQHLNSSRERFSCTTNSGATSCCSKFSCRLIIWDIYHTVVASQLLFTSLIGNISVINNY